MDTLVVHVYVQYLPTYVMALYVNNGPIVLYNVLTMLPDHLSTVSNIVTYAWETAFHVQM